MPAATTSPALCSTPGPVCRDHTTRCAPESRWPRRQELRNGVLRSVPNAGEPAKASRRDLSLACVAPVSVVRRSRERGRRRRARYLGVVAAARPSMAYDRVLERRRAVALAQHFREAEGLSIAQIAQRLGRSPATIKAYFYDPRTITKGLQIARRNDSSGRLLVMRGRRCASPSSPVAATARGRRSRLPDSSGCVSLERRYSGPRYCP
jgi:hypothetical protein